MLEAAFLGVHQCSRPGAARWQYYPTQALLLDKARLLFTKRRQKKTGKTSELVVSVWKPHKIALGSRVARAAALFISHNQPGFRSESSWPRFRFFYLQLPSGSHIAAGLGSSCSESRIAVALGRPHCCWSRKPHCCCPREAALLLVDVSQL
jgi:hypothetical protein